VSAALDQTVASAVDALASLEALDARVDLLRGVADTLDEAAGTLVPVAERETGLGVARLTGEVGRTSFQLRLMADVVADGTVFDARIDHACATWPPAPRPDLRRASLAIGPVVVFAAGNFPFAFSVAGGDTASAWAAGCPVVLKAHPGHPELSRLVAELIRRVAAEIAPGALGLIESEEDGRGAVCHPEIRAGAFTGSLAGGRALFDLACARAEPIPFFAEMGSINPVFVTPAAAARRANEIAGGFADSFTLGCGQFCTKPGLVVVPESFDRQLLLDALANRSGGRLLTAGIAEAYARGLEALSRTDGAELLVAGTRDGLEFTPSLVLSSLAAVLEHPESLMSECFGPVSVVASYRQTDELLAFATQLEGQLTATIHAEEDDAELAGELVRRLSPKAGRVAFNGWPTGVAVTSAMQHGGPYPATTAPGTTSVGTAAVERFVRPVTFQDIPDALLPPPLQESNPWNIVRRVDGKLAEAKVVSA